MTITTTSAFSLPEHLTDKADASLIARDEEHFAEIAASLEHRITDLSDRIDELRLAPGGQGRAAMDRDLEIHRLSAQLRALRRFGLDLCLGRVVHADDSEPTYIGRLGLRDSSGRQLLVDWRTPAAEPFFGATHADPMGLASRRRYRWSDGRITDFWDEVFTPEAMEGHAALDDQSAFIASLGGSRSDRMRDVLGTIQADQDAIIRAGSDGTLVVDGGPGTGKTVVALHRTAYLLYSDARMGHRDGGVLFIGPHQPYLNYVADVLPSLGEEGVQTATLAQLVPEGASAAPEQDPEVERLKAAAAMVRAVEPAVALYEQPPTESMTVETPSVDVRLTAADWAEAFASPEPGTPHNEARDQVWEALLDILMDKLSEELGEERPDDDRWDDGGWDEPEEFDAYGLGGEDPDDLRMSLAVNHELGRAFSRAWPLLEATDIVADLWSTPAYLRMCAPWLEPAQVTLLQRPDPDAWTLPDLPLLDAARRRLGDAGESRRRRRQEAAAAAERARMADVVGDLIAHDDTEMKVMSMLRGQDLRTALVDEGALPDADVDLLAGPFAHIVVDEAQELTDAQWQMLLARCPSRSFTVVGDRAQARHGFLESWEERLERAGLGRITTATLGINYRTPAEVMAEAEPVIRSVLPDANVPSSVRRSGIPVVHSTVADLESILEAWLTEHAEGVACVIGHSGFEARPRVRSLTPQTAKGLEFDLVVLVAPETWGGGVEGAVDRYVAMTRATKQLVILA